MSERDPRFDPRPWDVLRLDDGKVATVDDHRMRRKNEYVYGSGTAKELVFYRLRQHPGVQFNMGISGWKKMCRNAEALHRAEDRAAKEHVCGLSGFGAPGDECPACRARTDRWDRAANADTTDANA